MIGQFKRLITIKTWIDIQDEGGGSDPHQVDSYDLRAKVEQRSGSQFSGQGQTLWSYDYKITVRYEKSRILKSNQTIDYDGKRLAINSIAFEDEGKRKFCICRCSTIDSNVDTGNDLIASIKTFEYFGIGGELEFTADGTAMTAPTVTTDLRGKTIVRAYKDGIRFSLITSGTPSTTDKEVLTNSVTARFLWSVLFEPGERALIDYIG